MDADEVTGDQGREDAFELRLTLLREGVLGTRGAYSGVRTDLAFARFGGVGLMVPAGSGASSTFVELFHGCLSDFSFTVEFGSSIRSRRLEAGEDSGVRLWLYLCPFSGVSGAPLVDRLNANIEVRCRRSNLTGSDDGPCDCEESLDTEDNSRDTGKGVTGTGGDRT